MIWRIRNLFMIFMMLFLISKWMTLNKSFRKKVWLNNCQLGFHYSILNFWKRNRWKSNKKSRKKSSRSKGILFIIIITLYIQFIFFIFLGIVYVKVNLIWLILTNWGKCITIMNLVRLKRIHLIQVISLVNIVISRLSKETHLIIII